MRVLIERLSRGASPMSPRITCCFRRPRWTPTRGAALWNVRASLARRDDRWRACRCRALQARFDGFRVVEALETERAGLAEPRRYRSARAPRLAYRVLGDVDGDTACAIRRRSAARILASIHFRHSRRRDRSRFPHHENEIAQSCCAFDSTRMANVWMHNGFLQVEGEKMSKSLGNFITIHDLLRTTNSAAAHGRARCCASRCCARITVNRSTGR